MAIGILNSRYPKSHFSRLADLSIDLATWPYGKPKSAQALGDLSEADDLVVFFRTKLMTAKMEGIRCRITAFQSEPPAIHGKSYRLLPFVANRYHRILTHNSGLLTRLPNTRFVPRGGCMLGSVPETAPEKTKRVALIASHKRSTVGHRLRHQIAKWSKTSAPDLDLFGKGYHSVEDKGDGHRPYYFSAVIENSREPGYFTEKLIDSLLCWSLPIYWGAPDIAHFFDPRGMIICNDEASLREAIQRVTPEDYFARLPWLEENRRRALEVDDLDLNLARALQEDSESARWAA